MNRNDDIQEITDVGTIVTPPGYPWYAYNKNCRVLVRLKNQQRIRLDFLFISVACSSTSIVEDYLRIYDGDDVHEKLIGDSCGTTHLKTLTSSENTLFMHFHSDSKTNAYGFRIKVTSGKLHRMKQQ